MNNPNATLSDDDVKEINRKLENAERYEEALRSIDNHIRSTSDPIPHIISTLKSILPEYE